MLVFVKVKQTMVKVYKHEQIFYDTVVSERATSKKTEMKDENVCSEPSSPPACIYLACFQMKWRTDAVVFRYARFFILDEPRGKYLQE